MSAPRRSAVVEAVEDFGYTCPLLVMAASIILLFLFTLLLYVAWG